jgi:hypothetical protein
VVAGTRGAKSAASLDAGQTNSRDDLSGGSATLVKAKSVIPAKAGIHRSTDKAVEKWIPAFAGMTAY